MHGRRPVILDDTFGSPETAALRYEGHSEGGLLRPGSPSEFPPMSAYGKPPPQVQGFDGSRSFAEPSFPYTTPPYVSQPPPTGSTYYNAPQVTSVGYGGRGQYDDQDAYLSVGSTPIPQVMSYQPTSGRQGTTFQVNVSAVYELATSSMRFSIMFNMKKCPATGTKLQQQGAVCQYVVVAEVPPFTTTGYHSASLPVYLLLENADGDLLGKVDVGIFNYDDRELQNSDRQSLHVRKPSGESMSLMKSSARQLSIDTRHKEDLSQLGYTAQETIPQASYLQSGQPFSGIMPQYSRQTQYQAQTQRPAYYSSAPSPPTIKIGSPQASSWNAFPPPQATNTSRMAPSPGISATGSMSRPTLTAMPSPMSANPPLVRTLTQQSPGPAHTPTGAGQSGHSFPYAIYQGTKASLKIQGNLDLMSSNWSYDEVQAKRRLVMFKRSQSGSEVTTTFKPVTPDERPHNSVCISCIWWEEKQEAFVTSVDTIFLLEKLVAARFTVEEKNRIRRNLEGYRPLTVSKGKSDSENIFKIIMGFPNPKPRNIEKDIKVFPWKILAAALRKIISKYSASPSSTLPPGPTLPTPVSQSSYTNESSATMVNQHSEPTGLISPRSISRSMSGTSVSTYATRSSPIPKQSASSLSSVTHLQSGNGGPPDVRVSVPNYNTQGQSQSQQWPPPQHHMSAYSASHLGEQRASWDLNGIFPPQAGPAMPGNGGNSGNGLHPHYSLSNSRLSLSNVSSSDGEKRTSHRMGSS